MTLTANLRCQCLLVLASDVILHSKNERDPSENISNPFVLLGGDVVAICLKITVDG